MLALSYLIARCAGTVLRASEWHLQVMGWGQGQTPGAGGDLRLPGGAWGRGVATGTSHHLPRVLSFLGTDQDQLGTQ